MVMKIKRCPACKKARRCEEGYTSDGKEKVRPVWVYSEKLDLKICSICAKRNEDSKYK